LWNSDQRSRNYHHQQQQQQQHQKQQHGNNVFVSVNVVANDNAKPELMYAQIEPAQANVTLPTMHENGAVIYSKLQKAVEPSTDFCQNLS